KHDLPRVIHPHRVKHVLCEIDPEDGHLLLHWTRLLWLNGFPNLLELIVAHCSRSAQGAGPFHYDPPAGGWAVVRGRLTGGHRHHIQTLCGGKSAWADLGAAHLAGP